MVKQIMPKAGEAILALFNKLGGNMNNVLGTRSNITFLGKGKNPEGFIDMDINSEAIGFMGKNKILQELETLLFAKEGRGEGQGRAMTKTTRLIITRPANPLRNTNGSTLQKWLF